MAFSSARIRGEILSALMHRENRQILLCQVKIKILARHQTVKRQQTHSYFEEEDKAVITDKLL